MSKRPKSPRKTDWRPWAKLASLTLGLIAAVALGAQTDDAYPVDCPGIIGPDGLAAYVYEGKLFTTQQWRRTGYPHPGHLNIARFEGTEDFLDTREEWQWQDPTATFSCNRFTIIPGRLVVDAHNGYDYGGRVVPFGMQLTDTTLSSPPVGNGGSAGNDEDEPAVYLCFRYKYADGTFGPWLWCERIS